MKVRCLLLIICTLNLTGCNRTANPTANSNDSSTAATTDRKLTPEPTPEPSSPVTLNEPREPSTKFTNLRLFVAKLQRVELLRLFEGLPHQMFALQLYQQELQTKKTVNFHGFPFYEETLAPTDAHSTGLTNFFRDRKSFKPYWGPKMCGGFHPDYCLEWHVGEEIIRALVCFTCHEVMLFGPNLELYCDIADKAWGMLWELLEPYHKNRPGPRMH